MKIVCLSVLVVLLAAGVHGVAVGGNCAAPSDNCDADLVCDKFPAVAKCAKKFDAVCTAGDTGCVTGAECKTLKCACKAGYAQNGDFCAGDNTIGGKCTGTGKGTCKDGNAMCTNLKCACKDGYDSTDKATCMVKANKNGGSCTGGPQKGTCTDNALCSKDVAGTCSCTEHFNGAIGKECTAIDAGKFGGACEAEKKCSAANTKCSDKNYCVCEDGYTGTKGADCKKNSASGLVISVTALMLTAIAGRMTWA